MIGRAYLWGMAAGGERGVTNVLEILRQGVSETLLGDWPRRRCTS